MNLRPSKSHRWVRCSLYPTLAANLLPTKEIDAAREGTAAAWVAELVIRGEIENARVMLDKTHENGWLVDRDMCDVVQEYCDMVMSREGVTMAEKEVTFSTSPPVAGTLDSGTIAILEKVLYLDDLKYGRKPVEVYGNTQELIYVMGLFNMYPYLWHQINKIQLGIYQPRAMHHDGTYRKWTIDTEDLKEWSAWIYDRAVLTQSPDAIATPGEWCGHCEAANGCEALRQTIFNLVALVESVHYREPDASEMAHQLDFLNDAADYIKILKTATESAASEMIRNTQIPRYRMEKSYGRPVLKTPGKVIEAMTGISPFDVKLCTPAELKRREVPAELVKAFSFYPNTKFKLTRVRDDRAQQIFGDKK